VNIKRIIISFVLLLTYSLGFAHNIIPHQHDSETQTHKHSHSVEHTHSHHNATNELDHEHISHGDHFDEGFYDLLVCFLHETDFKTDDCNIYYMAPTKVNVASNNQTQQLLAVVSTLSSLVSDSENFPSEIFVDNDSTKEYLSPSIDDSPLRGPPVLS
jgi:hypothetical protein